MNKKIIYLVVGLAILGIGGYFLYTLLTADEGVVTISASKTINTTFKTEIFSDKKFTGLKNYVSLPVLAGQQGKTNPFMKF